MRPTNFLHGCRCPKCQISSSKGEQRIEKFLMQNKIEYVAQKKFKELLGTGGGKLSYDFYLPTHNFLIEYQGAQHKRCFDFFGGESRLKNQQIHDNRKREYAKSKNIKLLEIWYYENDKIETILENNLIKK